MPLSYPLIFNKKMYYKSRSAMLDFNESNILGREVF